MDNFIWPAAIATGGAGVVLGTAAAVRHRRARHLNEVAEREKAGAVRSHNAKHRKKLDRMMSEDEDEDERQTSRTPNKTKPAAKGSPLPELFSGVT